MKLTKVKILMKKIFFLMLMCGLVLNLESMASVKAAEVCIHEKGVSQSHTTGVKYSNSASSYCYACMEYSTYQCNTCGAKWVQEQVACTVSHVWVERVEYYSDEWVYFRMVCTSCGCGKFSRKEKIKYIPIHMRIRPSFTEE